MKITGLYQLMNPRTLKYFGINVYKVVAAIEVMHGVIGVALFIISSFYHMEDTNELMSNFMCTVAIFFSTFKIFWLSINSKRIWNNLDMTSINFLTYPCHKKETLQNGRAKSILQTILFVILWSSVTVVWVIAPILLEDSYVSAKTKDEIRRFRYNIGNNVYPVSEEFYNGHFLYFYAIEFVQLMLWAHGFLTYDTFVIALCISIEYQLKTISASYTSVNDRKGKLYSNELSAYV